MRCPFDWRNPFGYVIAFFIQYMFNFYVSYVAVSLSCFMIGTYWMLVSVAKDLKYMLFAINRNMENQNALLLEFSELIRLHSDSKQFSKQLLCKLLYSTARMLIYFFVDWFMILRVYANFCCCPYFYTLHLQFVVRF